MSKVIPYYLNVPDPLYDRMRKFPKVNWRDVAIEAFQKRLEELEAESGQNPDTMSKEDFAAFLQWASAVVSQWPQWKQNVLKNSMRPTRSSPRVPVCNDYPTPRH